MSTVRPPTLTSLPSYVAGQLARIGRQLLVETLDRHGLRPPHFATLAALSDFGPLPQHELADRLGFNRSHAVKYLDVLQQRGMVRRDPDPGDRRRYVVVLTGPGRELFDELERVARASQERFLRVLDESERRTLMDLMGRVLEAEPDEHASSRAAPPLGHTTGPRA